MDQKDSSPEHEPYGAYVCFRNRKTRKIWLLLILNNPEVVCTVRLAIDFYWF